MYGTSVFIKVIIDAISGKPIPKREPEPVDEYTTFMDNLVFEASMYADDIPTGHRHD